MNKAVEEIVRAINEEERKRVNRLRNEMRALAEAAFESFAGLQMVDEVSFWRLDDAQAQILFECGVAVLTETDSIYWTTRKEIARATFAVLVDKKIDVLGCDFDSLEDHKISALFNAALALHERVQRSGELQKYAPRNSLSRIE